MSFLIYRWI